jgi:hypothetical protein
MQDAGLTTTKKAKLRRINPSEEGQPPVVQFSVPNARAKYGAGQWVFICIPKLGILHWHPFSISSASLDLELTLHFVCNGKWTSQVARLAEDNSEMKVQQPPALEARLHNKLNCKENCYRLCRCRASMFVLPSD